MGGDISVDSVLNEWTVFTIRLPFMRDDEKRYIDQFKSMKFD